MNRVYVNLGIGIFWLFAAGLLYINGSLDPAELAVFIIMALLFFWSAYKLFVNPQLTLKKKKNLVEKISDPNYKVSSKKRK